MFHILGYILFVGSSQHEGKLIKDLLKYYEPYARPSFNASLPLAVKHGITIQTLDLDIDKQLLTANSWISMEWQDVHLKWNSSDYGGVTNIRLPSTRIWVPDIIPYNTEEYTTINPRKQMIDIVIHSNGNSL